MAEEPEQEPTQNREPDLALPSLFGRRKRRGSAPRPDTDAASAQEDPARRLPPLPPPVTTAPPEPERESEPEPEPEAEPEPEPEPTVALPPVTSPVAPPPVRPPPPREPVLPVETARTQPEPAATAGPVAPSEPKKPKGPTKPKKERKPLVLPSLNPYLAAVVVGALCGLIAILLEIGVQRGCESVRGVGTCGGIGFVALLIVLGLTVVIGGVLLRVLGVKDPTSTSLLGIGIVAVVTMVFFLGSLESMWMFVVLPLLGAIAFAASYWVTDAVVNVARDEDTSTTVT